MFLTDYNLHRYISKMHGVVPQVHNTFITNDHNYIFEI